MSVEKARAHYIGKAGHERLNCAQAIVKAFREKWDLREAALADFASCGGGHAPAGLCGSLYAAKVLLEKTHPEKVNDCEAALLAQAGSVYCREIRSSRKLSCVECVETVAEYMERV